MAKTMGETGRNNKYVRRATVLTQGVMFGSLVGVGVMALAIDTGQMFATRAEMQRLADAAALAGASGLIQGASTVGNRVNALAAANSMVAPPENDLDADTSAEQTSFTIGFWKGDERRFYPVSGPTAVSPNAVQVTSARADVPLFFAHFLGVNATDVTRSATAVSSSGVCAGVWGMQGVLGDGNLLTDSYDADAGAYGAGNRNPHGDVCSCGDIVINGSVDVYGDTIYGNGYDLLTYGNSYNIYGHIGEQVCGTTTPTFAIPDHVAMNDNAQIGLTSRGRDPFGGTHWDFSVAGTDSLTIAGGDFYFTSASVAGQAQVIVTGPTTIVIDGPASFSGGGIINATGDPRNLIIYSTGTTLNFSGGSAFYGAVIAPNATVLLEGTNDFYGTVLADYLDVNGDSQFHVEESLVYELFGVHPVAPILVE